MLENLYPSTYSGTLSLSEMPTGLWLLLYSASQNKAVWYWKYYSRKKKCFLHHATFEWNCCAHAVWDPLSTDARTNTLESLANQELQNQALITQNFPLLCCEHFTNTCSHTHTKKYKYLYNINILWAGRNLNSKKKKKSPKLIKVNIVKIPMSQAKPVTLNQLSATAISSLQTKCWENILVLRQAQLWHRTWKFQHICCLMSTYLFVAKGYEKGLLFAMS